jgi:hypothetical protein
MGTGERKALLTLGSHFRSTMETLNATTIITKTTMWDGKAGSIKNTNKIGVFLRHIF